MFLSKNECNSLTELYLSSFDTSKVTNTGYMFEQARNLKTIYVSNIWNLSNVTDSTNMFMHSSSLVGESGTKFTYSYTDKTYARIGGGTSSPGYFTYKKYVSN